jgi:hypothetical protein
VSEAEATMLFNRMNALPAYHRCSILNAVFGYVEDQEKVLGLIKERVEQAEAYERLPLTVSELEGRGQCNS